MKRGPGASAIGVALVVALLASRAPAGGAPGTWSALGEGVNGPVREMAVWRDRLVVIGDFDSAGTVAANHVAMWDGARWSAMGTGWYYPRNVAASGDTLVVAGQLPGHSQRELARWDGTQWIPEATYSGFQPRGNGLRIFQGRYYLCLFGTFPGRPYDEWARVDEWDGSAWHTVRAAYSDAGVSLGHASFVVEATGGQLYALEGSHRRMDVFDGSSWTSLPGDTRVYLAAGLTRVGDTLYAFGESPSGFTVLTRQGDPDWPYVYYPFAESTIACDADIHVVRPYHGALVAGASAWRNYECHGFTGNVLRIIGDTHRETLGLLLESTLSSAGYVDDLVEYRGGLIAGGDFTRTDDGLLVRNVARYDELVTPVAFTALAAHWTGEGVVLDWVLDADEPLSGFEVYRRSDDSPPGPWRRVNAAALGPAARTWRDASVERGRRYAYRVDALTVTGARFRSPLERVRVAAATTALEPATPNPFHVRTTIAFEMARPGRVELAVYDAAGRRVRTLVRGVRGAGRGVLAWDGRDAIGRRVASGVYFVRMRAPGYAHTRKVVLLR